METKIDALGRIVVPKPLRDRLMLKAGDVLDISWYDHGLRIIPGGRTARLEPDADGRLVAVSDTEVTDDMVFDAIDAGRR